MIELLDPTSSAGAGGGLDDAALEGTIALSPGALVACMIQSLDGAVAVDGRSGGLGSSDDQRVLAALRGTSDVVLVGASTVTTEEYGPVWMAQARRERRLGRGQEPLPRLAVVSGRASLDPGAKIFTETREDQPPAPRPLVFVTAQAEPARVRALAEVAEVVTAGDTSLDLHALRSRLASIGTGRVSCEGGPHLLQSLLGAGLVDGACVTAAPLFVPAGATRLPSTEGPGVLVRMGLRAVLRSGDHLFLSYDREQP